MRNYIGVFDSGKGGLSILEELKKLLPDENFIYYGDSINNPYGSKSNEELISITKDIVFKLKMRGCKLIVIACNTATTRCRKKLEELFPDLIFVGTVPAIKVAYDNNSLNTLVMATPSTITSERTNELISEFKRDNQNIYLEACYDLASAIENDDNEIIDKILKSLYLKYKDKTIDSIVLGCTHYSLIKDKISAVFGDVLLLDGCLGVAREVKRQIGVNNLESYSEGSVLILNSLN